MISGLKKTLSLALSASALSGCIDLQRRAHAIEQLHTVSVEEVSLPDRATYDGPESKLGDGGGLASFVPYVMSEDKADLLADYFKRNQINAAAILKSEFIAALNRDPHFSGKVVEQGGDAHFVLDVEEYGVYETIPFSARFVPRFVVKATLFSSDGKAIWEPRPTRFHRENRSGDPLGSLLGARYVMSAALHQAAELESEALIFRLDQVFR